MTQTKDEYLKKSSTLALGFGRTADFADVQRGTTAQSADGVGELAENLPGQVFAVDQLPDPSAAIAYGLPPVRLPEHLIVDGKDADNHVQGKDPMDVAAADLRRSLGDPMLAYDGTVTDFEGSLKSLEERGQLDDSGLDESGMRIDPEGVQKAPGADAPVKDGDAGIKETTAKKKA